MAVTFTLNRVTRFTRGLPEEVKVWLCENIGSIITSTETWWYNNQPLEPSFTRSQAIAEILKRIKHELKNDNYEPQHYTNTIHIVAKGWKFLSHYSFITHDKFGISETINVDLHIDDDVLSLQFKLTWL
jgi:hypothetical protein